VSDDASEIPSTDISPIDEEQEDAPHFRIPRADLLISLAIVLATFAAYAPALGFDFVGLDDSKYIYNNAHLRAALSMRTLRWMVLSFDPDNWFPVTRISHYVDFKLFGSQAWGYHAGNLLIHIGAALLLFGFLRRATQVRWPSAFVAFMFALHPLHVESVAWISERKDVLCAFFWFATLWAWLRYTERPGLGRYAAALVLFSLGLMSKPMIVTLPFLLYVLDVWPFRRAISKKLIAEKIPFILLSGAVMALTVVAQRSAGAVQPLDVMPPAMRLKNALFAVVAYIGNTLWPARIGIAYAYPMSFPAWKLIIAGAAIGCVSAIALLQVRKRPWLAAGWFWFLGTLVPVIGLMQVGMQARADRYMYVPMVGLSIMLAWGFAEIATRWPEQGRRAALVLGTAACLAMGLKTTFQTQYWKSSETLFRHATDIDSRNYLAWDYLGLTLEAHPEKANDAIVAFRSSLKIRPEFAMSHNNLAAALCKANKLDEGIAEYREALRISPFSGQIHSNLAVALLSRGRRDEAIDEYETALRLDPWLLAAHNDLGVLLWKTPGRSADGLRHLERAVELDPDYALAQCSLAQALLNVPDRLGDSIDHFNKALEISEDFPAAHRGLAAALMRVPGMQAEAIAQMQEALRLEPNARQERPLDPLERN